jgi:hypothetical protein
MKVELISKLGKFGILGQIEEILKSRRSFVAELKKQSQFAGRQNWCKALFERIL